MRQASRLKSWIRQLTPEFAKFAVVGAFCFVFADVGSNLLRFQAGLDPLTSAAIPTIIATGIAFVGNRYWTFRHRERTGVSREGILFFALNLAALVIQEACIGFTSYVLGLTGKLPYNVALVAGIALGMLFRFWSYRKWVWRRASPASASQQSTKPQFTA